MFQSFVMSSVTSSINHWLASVASMLSSSSGLLAVAAVLTALYLLRALSKKLKDKLGIGLKPILAIAFLAYVYFSMRGGGAQKLYNRLPPGMVAKKAQNLRQKQANRQAGKEIDAMIGNYVANVPPVTAPPLVAPPAAVPRLPSLPNVAAHKLPTLPRVQHHAAVAAHTGQPVGGTPIMAMPPAIRPTLPSAAPAAHNAAPAPMLNDPIVIPPGPSPSTAATKAAATPPASTPPAKPQTAKAATSYAELVPHEPATMQPEPASPASPAAGAGFRHTAEVRRRRREERDAARAAQLQASGGFGSSVNMGGAFDKPATASSTTGSHATSATHANQKPQLRHGGMPSQPMAGGQGMGMGPHPGNQMPMHPGFGGMGMGMQPGMGMGPMGGGHMGMMPEMPAMPPHLGGMPSGAHHGGYR